MRHEEWHVTVEGDPFRWRGFCAAVGIKPLHIELNNFERQLMCASTMDPRKWIEVAGFPIIRVKHEVSALLPDEQASYWECHVKLDGPFQPHAPMSSRDLFREARWYVTHRQVRPFDPTEFIRWVTFHAEVHGCTVAGTEYEGAILDTNPHLDKKWMTSVELVQWD